MIYTNLHLKHAYVIKLRPICFAMRYDLQQKFYGVVSDSIHRNHEKQTRKILTQKPPQRFDNYTVGRKKKKLFLISETQKRGKVVV